MSEIFVVRVCHIFHDVDQINQNLNHRHRIIPTPSTFWEQFRVCSLLFLTNKERKKNKKLAQYLYT